MRSITVDTISFERKSIPFNKNICQPRISCGVETEADLDKVLSPTTKFEIKVEDVTNGYTNDFVKAFAMLLFIYYIFNIAYNSNQFTFDPEIIS